MIATMHQRKETRTPFIPSGDISNTLNQSMSFQKAREELASILVKLFQQEDYAGARPVMDTKTIFIPNMPFSGGSEVLFGIVPNGNGYKIECYSGDPVYLPK